MTYTIHVPILLPVRLKKAASEVQPGQTLFLHVDRWNGSYDVPVDAVDTEQGVVTVTSGKSKHRLPTTVLVYETYPWWHTHSKSCTSSPTLPEASAVTGVEARACSS